MVQDFSHQQSHLHHISTCITSQPAHPLLLHHLLNASTSTPMLWANNVYSRWVVTNIRAIPWYKWLSSRLLSIYNIIAVSMYIHIYIYIYIMLYNIIYVQTYVWYAYTYIDSYIYNICIYIYIHTQYEGLDRAWTCLGIQNCHQSQHCHQLKMPQTLDQRKLQRNAQSTEMRIWPNHLYTLSKSQYRSWNWL